MTDNPPASIHPTHGWRGYRWRICALLFFATTVNYMDRQILGILAPTLQREIGWNEVDYGNIVAAFQMAYALGLLATGGLIDRYGVRLGYAAALAAWSLAAMAHAAAGSVAGFAAARFALGLGEGGNYPAAIKAVAEWFPRRERAFATGLFNAGSNVGAILAPLAVPAIALTWGWRWAFIVVGAVGLLWLIFWLPVYRPPAEHPRVGKDELDHIHSDPPEPAEPIPWLRLLTYRQTWVFVLVKFLTDPVWWFYLYWSAKFLDKNFGIKLSQLSLPLVAIYLVADVGSIGGGWISARLLRRGWTLNASRKTAMLICGVCALPVIFAAGTQSLWMAVGLISLAAAAHQGWSANVFTLPSDVFPRRAVGSVIGIGGMAGAVGGILFSKITGHLLEWSGGNYFPIFAGCACAYLLTLVLVQVLTPRLEPVRM